MTTAMVDPGRAVRLAVIGCGDVLARSYAPGLAAAGAKIAACFDERPERAKRAVEAHSEWSPDAVACDTLDSLLGQPELDGVLNLTPAPLHASITQAALDAHLNVYSEKPLAGSVVEAERLIAAANERDRLLLCAPAIMAAPRFRWLQTVLRSGRIGPVTLASGQFANLGPAALAGYTGDPRVHYGAQVGPLVDQGVYLLHAITGLLGPVRRVQALAATALPLRKVTAGRHRGEPFHVECRDHVLLQFELDDGVLGRLLSSFAVPASLTPALEIHAAAGTVSLDGIQDALGPVNVYLSDADGSGLSGWLRWIGPTAAEGPRDLIAVGAAHFVNVLRGDEPARLSARHACHVLAIIEAAGESVKTASSVDVAVDIEGGASRCP